MRALRIQKRRVGCPARLYRHQYIYYLIMLGSIQLSGPACK